MASVNDVVELNDGSVGVVAEEVPSGGAQLYRVWFPTYHLVLSDGEISQTLSAPSYSVNQQISIWPYLGTIKSIVNDEFTVEVERSQFIAGLGNTSWTATHKVKRWRVIKDNDGRLQGVH